MPTNKIKITRTGAFEDRTEADMVGYQLSISNLVSAHSKWSDEDNSEQIKAAAKANFVREPTRQYTPGDVVGTAYGFKPNPDDNNITLSIGRFIAGVDSNVTDTIDFKINLLPDGMEFDDTALKISVGKVRSLDELITPQFLDYVKRLPNELSDSKLFDMYKNPKQPTPEQTRSKWSRRKPKETPFVGYQYNRNEAPKTADQKQNQEANPTITNIQQHLTDKFGQFIEIQKSNSFPHKVHIVVPGHLENEGRVLRDAIRSYFKQNGIEIPDSDKTGPNAFFIEKDKLNDEFLSKLTKESPSAKP